MSVDFTKKQSARLFFATQPPKTLQKQLGHFAQRHARQSGGRSIKPDNIHLTLLFLGQIPNEQIPTLIAAGNHVTEQSFSLTIQKFGYWQRNQIIYATAATYPQTFFSLVGAIKNHVKRAGFAFDNRAYKPHITLVRKAAQFTGTNLQNPIVWPVKEWLLMQSNQTGQGVVYQTCYRWRLD